MHTWLEGALPRGRLPADEVAALIRSLQAVDASGAPEPGCGRGRPLANLDEYVRDALTRVDAPGALELWERAAQAPQWDGPRVWIHCDLDARNVLVRAGRLAAVLDWGGAGVGDPALDVMAAWKLVAREERERFRALLDVDDATWLRAQGWARAQALIALGYYTLENYPPLVHEARRWLAELLRRLARATTPRAARRRRRRAPSPRAGDARRLRQAAARRAASRSRPTTSALRAPPPRCRSAARAARA